MPLGLAAIITAAITSKKVYYFWIKESWNILWCERLVLSSSMEKWRHKASNKRHYLSSLLFVAIFSVLNYWLSFFENSFEDMYVCCHQMPLCTPIIFSINDCILIMGWWGPTPCNVFWIYSENPSALPYTRSYFMWLLNRRIDKYGTIEDESQWHEYCSVRRPAEDAQRGHFTSINRFLSSLAKIKLKIFVEAS